MHWKVETSDTGHSPWTWGAELQFSPSSGGVPSSSCGSGEKHHQRSKNEVIAMENACLGFLLVTLSPSHSVKLHVNSTLLCFRMSCRVLTFCDWRPNTTSLSSCCMTTCLWVQIKVTPTDLGLSYLYIFIFFGFNRAARDHRLKCPCCWKKNQSPRPEVKQTSLLHTCLC